MCRVDFYDYLAIVVRKLLISATLDKLAEKNTYLTSCRLQVYATNVCIHGSTWPSDNTLKVSVNNFWCVILFVSSVISCMIKTPLERDTIMSSFYIVLTCFKLSHPYTYWNCLSPIFLCTILCATKSKSLGLNPFLVF